MTGKIKTIAFVKETLIDAEGGNEKQKFKSAELNFFEIQLSNETTDTLVLNLKVESQICGWPFFTLNSATYNNVLRTLEDFNGNYLIRVIELV